MGFLIVGVLLSVLKALEVSWVAGWPWWWVLLPFALAVLWWQWSDASGRTQRLAVERDKKRRKDRLQERAEALRPRARDDGRTER